MEKEGSVKQNIIAIKIERFLCAICRHWPMNKFILVNELPQTFSVHKRFLYKFGVVLLLLVYQNPPLIQLTREVVRA